MLSDRGTLMDDYWRVSTSHNDDGSTADDIDRLRRECTRLEKEAVVSASIALDLFQALRAADAQVAGETRTRIMFRYGRYRDDDGFPNLRDLLDRLVNEHAPG